MGSVGIVIPTFNAGENLRLTLPILTSSALRPCILVVDSSSTDQTVLITRQLGAEAITIPRDEFNHGATREIGRKIINTDIVVMMTQDAWPVDERMLDNLVRPLLRGEASVSYARQVPHEGAGILEAFPRSFNYGGKPQIRDINDVEKYGVYTFFCSDSCAAYLNSALDEIGGFQPTLIWEDQFTVAKLLKKGHRIAYVPDAVVRHSHRYSLTQEFRRYFDTGYVLAENSWFTDMAGAAEGRGKEFLRALLKLLLKNKPFLMPYAIVNTIFKWAGYRTGYCSLNAPIWFKSFMSSQKYYWKSKYFHG